MRPVIILLLILGLTATPTSASAQSRRATPASQPAATIKEQVARATSNANQDQEHLLKYRFSKGDQIRWTVEHVASTRTQMQGESEKTSSRSESVKLWEVTSVDSLGQMTFDHKIESVNMWQKIGDQDPVTFDSTKDDEAPLEYESIADKIGTTIATVSINSAGQIVDRKSANANQANFGVGDIAVPLPTKAVPVGYKWSVPDVLRAKDGEGNPRQLKSRVIYELIKVKSNNAYISFKTEVLTPVESEKIRSQIMQQMTRGYLVFDMQRGYPIRKEVEWDEKVQGFEGNDSLLEYLGRLTERIIDQPASKVTRKPTQSLKPLK